MVKLVALLVLLAFGAAPSAALRQLLETAAPRPVLRVGFRAESAPPISSLENGEPAGLEGLVIKAVAARAGYDLQIVPLDSWVDRIPALLNGTVDAVIDSFIVTAERSKLVQFLYPSYFSSGAVVSAPGGTIEGVDSWDDLSGKTLSVLEGNYVIDAARETPALRNVTLLLAPNIEEAAEAVYNGSAVGHITDSSWLFPAPNLTIVPELEPILRAPFSVAVKIGADELAENLSKALLSLAEGGSSAPMLRMEEETFGAVGAPPNPDLAALVADPTRGNSSLYPAVERDCWPAPSDSIWLPADAYQAIHTWKTVGVQNYTCDPATGNYTFQGWLANGTDSMSDKHAGYSYTARGPSGTHAPTFIATDESNQTVLGALNIYREVGALDMPSPTDPATNAVWFRHPAYGQSGMHTTPKILFLSRTDTEGGALPAGTGPCKEGDPTIMVPITSIVTFFACRDGV